MREVASHFVFLVHRLFGQAKVARLSIERGSASTEEVVRATLQCGGVELAIDAAVAGDLEDDNRFEVVGSRKSAAITDWYRLVYEGETSERVVPTASQLDHLAAMLAGKKHQLATFTEAAAVVEVIESILGG